jgi:hypothetical protein
MSGRTRGLRWPEMGGAAKSVAVGGAEAGKGQAKTSFAPLGEMDGGRPRTASLTRELEGRAARIEAAQKFFLEMGSDTGSEWFLFYPQNRNLRLLCGRRSDWDALTLPFLPSVWRERAFSSASPEKNWARDHDLCAPCAARRHARSFLGS